MVDDESGMLEVCADTRSLGPMEFADGGTFFLEIVQLPFTVERAEDDGSLASRGMAIGDALLGRRLVKHVQQVAEHAFNHAAALGMNLC